ncbi:hypothetical protein BLNAU_9003 [Blattamonas nauphoetae]|uniref:RanBP2-type domain-containing protein n=1 Tax=Blattamonas nauphoetae TaxID=2049346 RepID=A0ABQ9XX04_9EUKA|nr:hypothetical protein BLNAU_9003 [Blattamonas nauphoetae]
MDDTDTDTDTIVIQGVDPNVTPEDVVEFCGNVGTVYRVPGTRDPAIHFLKRASDPLLRDVEVIFTENAPAKAAVTILSNLPLKGSQVSIVLSEPSGIDKQALEEITDFQQPPASSLPDGADVDPSQQEEKLYEDWVCPKCNSQNYEKRIRCFRCSTDKPPNPVTVTSKATPVNRGRRKHSDGKSGSGGDPQSRERGDTKWTCPKCGNNNWARRIKCNRCDAKRPFTENNQPSFRRNDRRSRRSYSRSRSPRRSYSRSRSPRRRTRSRSPDERRARRERRDSPERQRRYRSPEQDRRYSPPRHGHHYPPHEMGLYHGLPDPQHALQHFTPHHNFPPPDFHMHNQHLFPRDLPPQQLPYPNYFPPQQPPPSFPNEHLPPPNYPIDHPTQLDVMQQFMGQQETHPPFPPNQFQQGPPPQQPLWPEQGYPPPEMARQPPIHFEYPEFSSDSRQFPRDSERGYQYTKDYQPPQDQYQRSPRGY